MCNEWSIALMLNALEGSDYDLLCCQLVSQFQDARTTPNQTEFHDAIAFAGFEYKRRTAEQANVAKHQKNTLPKNKVICTNPKCKWQRVHVMKNCWSEGGAAAHKAPDWYKAMHDNRSTKANTAVKEKVRTKAANIGIEPSDPMKNCLEDGYESYVCIYAVENEHTPTERWSGIWDEHTTTPAHEHGTKTPA